MSSVVFVSWWGGGNMTPVLALGAEMRRRGHRIAVVGPARFADRLSLDDIDHVACASWTPSVDEVRAAVETVSADLVVIDFMMAEVLAAAPTFDARAAALVHTLWQPVADRRWDNIAVFTPLERINELRASLGLTTVDHAVDLLRDCTHIAIAEPEPIDRPVASDWPVARYLGPLLERPGRDASWRPPPGDEPLVVVGLGTTPMDERPVLERTLEAIAQIDGARFLVTVGDHLDADDLRAPPNTTVSPYVRHAAVMPHAALVVSHAGLGTTIAAAAYGIPMVCMPLGRDQPGNAERVRELGIGVTVAATAPADELRSVIAGALADDDSRDAAKALSEAIARRHPSPHDEFETLL